MQGANARSLETVPVGSRIGTASTEDRSRLGDAIHACIAANLATVGKPLDLPEVEAILDRMQSARDVEASAPHCQLGAIRSWLTSRWPEAVPVIEFPMARATAEGQQVRGRADLVLRTASGWILFDHKSTPQGALQWADLAAMHAGQLAGYRDVLEAASGLPVQHVWLVLPVAGVALRVELS